jgi:hypothetical protein
MRVGDIGRPVGPNSNVVAERGLAQRCGSGSGKLALGAPVLTWKVLRAPAVGPWRSLCPRHSDRESRRRACRSFVCDPSTGSAIPLCNGICCHT